MRVDPRAVFVLLLGLCACRPDPVRAFDEVKAVVAVSAGEAQRSLDDPLGYYVAARYNPASCDCPDFEVLLYGRWVRAHLRGDDETLAGLEHLRSDDAPTTAEVRGRLIAETWRSKRRVRYPVFRVSSTRSSEE